jgi:hypothetical protein
MRNGVRKDYLKGSRRHGRGHSPYPFDRLLTSRLGRLWDDVYSELCSEFDSRSFAGYRFRDNLDWHVYQHCWIGAETGTVYSDHRGCVTALSDEHYVHPWTGILCYAYPVPRDKSEKPVTHYDLKDGRSFDKIDGIWYFQENYSIKHEGWSEVGKADPWLVERSLDRMEINGVEFIKVRWTENISTKRQLSKKELRNNGLANANDIPFGKRCVVCGFDGKCVHAIRAEAEVRKLGFYNL